MMFPAAITAPAMKLMIETIKKITPNTMPAMAMPFFSDFRPDAPVAMAAIEVGSPNSGMNHAKMDTSPKMSEAKARPLADFDWVAGCCAYGA